MKWLIKALFIELYRRQLRKQVQAWKPGEARLSVLRELEVIERHR